MRCDFAAWAPITANYRAHGMSPNIRGFVPHVQVGTGSLQAFFSNPATQASAHFWCSKTGTLEQYLDSDDMAWAEGAGNPYFWSCEFEGQPDEAMTPAQLDMGGRLVAWLHSIQPFPIVVNEDPNGSGITPHRAGGQAWGGHSCPGDLRFGQYPDLILASLRHLDQNPGDDMYEQADRDHLISVQQTAENTQAAVGRIEAVVQAMAGNPAHLSALTDADLKAIEKGVADELANRLKS